MMTMGLIPLIWLLKLLKEVFYRSREICNTKVQSKK